MPVLRCRILERIGHAHALDWRLRRTVDRLRLRQLGRLENGRRHVDDVVELAAQPALCLDSLRPVDHHAVAGSAVVRRHLLGPCERRVECDRPARRHVRIGLGRPPLVHHLDEVGHLFRNAVEVRHFVEEPVHAALGARPVVTHDVEDERVVQLAHILDGLDDSADLLVGHVEDTPRKPRPGARRGVSRRPKVSPSPLWPRACARALSPAGRRQA